MAGGKASPDQVNLATRRSRAIELRLKGYTFNEIASELDIGTTQAYDDVKAALALTRDRMAEDANELRIIEGERLEAIWKKLFALLERSSDVEKLAKLVQQLHRNSELRMRLYGLESSRRIEIETHWQQEISGFVDLLAGRLPEETFGIVLGAIAQLMEEKDVALPAVLDVESEEINAE